MLVGTPRALLSEPVLLELQLFTSGGKRIIPIDFDGSLASEKNPDNPVLKLIGPTKLKVSKAVCFRGGFSRSNKQLRASKFL